MSTPFQNRLVGTIIVAAAAVIFLPDILDGDKQTNRTTFETIPKAPAFTDQKPSQRFPTAKLDRLPPEQLSDESAQDDLLTAQPQTAESDNAPVSINNDDNVQISAAPKEQGFESVNETPAALIEHSEAADDPQRAVETVASPAATNDSYAWVIQLGSFRHQKNVDELLIKLKANGYTVFTRPIKTQTTMLTKVFIGPELSKASLEQKLPKLKQLTNVQGKIARFQPGK